MPVTVFVDALYTSGGVDCHNVYAFYSASLNGSAALQEEVLDRWEEQFLPDWLAWLPDVVTVNEVTARSSNYPFPSSRDINLPGDIDLSGSVMLPPWLALHAKLNVSPNLLGDTGAPYTGMRPVRRGGKFFSGINDAFVDDLGYILPVGAQGTAFTAFIAALNDALTGSFGTLTAVVWGGAMDASGDKPSRPVVVAPITGAGNIQITKLKSRRT